MCSAILSVRSATGSKAVARREPYAVSLPPRRTRRPAPPDESARANRTWWDAEAADYYVEHGSFLGDTDFVWGPERLREEDASLLGDPHGGPRPRDRRRLGPVLPLAGSPRPRGRDRPLGGHGPAGHGDQRGHRPRATRALSSSATAGRCPLPARGLRHGLHGLRRRPVRRRLRRRHGGGRTGAASRRTLRLLDDPPVAVGLPRRPRARAG